MRCDSPIPLDVIGCSDIFARAHAFGLERRRNVWTLRSFTDPDREKLRAFGTRYGVDNLFPDHHRMLSAFEDGAVLVCTPTAAHAEPVVAALNAGRDVLCEKPMAMTLAEADSMREAARRNNRILQLCFMSRFAPCWLKVKELLDSGAIGKVMTVTVTQYWDGGTELYSNWRSQKAVSGGGIIADSAAHWIDILRWLMGEIGALTAAGIPAPDSPFPELDDTAFAMFRFQSGALGLLRNSWRHLRPENEAETVEIYGTSGTILGNLRTPWNDGGIQTVRLVRHGETREYEFHDPMQRFANQLETFAKLVRTRDAAAASAEDGRRALELQGALYDAMRKQCWIEV